jgi:hypothetical protein
MIPDDKIDHQKSDQSQKENGNGQNIKENLINDFSG